MTSTCESYEPNFTYTAGAAAASYFINAGRNGWGWNPSNWSSGSVCFGINSNPGTRLGCHSGLRRAFKSVLKASRGAKDMIDLFSESLGAVENVGTVTQSVKAFGNSIIELFGPKSHNEGRGDETESRYITDPVTGDSTHRINQFYATPRSIITIGPQWNDTIQINQE